MQPGHCGSNFSFDTSLRRVGWERLGGIASGTLPPLVRHIPAWPPSAAGAGSLGASFPKQVSFLPLICVCTGAAGAPRAGESWSPGTFPSPARLDSTQPCPKERGSRELGDGPSAVCRSTGVVLALLSRAAASHGGAGDGQQRWVWRAQRAVMMCQGDEAGRARGRRSSAEAALIWELQKCMPGASSSCSSWLRAALQTSLSKEVCEVGAASGRARAPTPSLRAASVPAPPVPAMSPSGSRTSPAMAALPAGTAGESRLGGLLLQSRGHRPPWPRHSDVTARCLPGRAGCLMKGLLPQARLGKSMEGQDFVRDADREF